MPNLEDLIEEEENLEEAEGQELGERDSFDEYDNGDAIEAQVQDADPTPEDIVAEHPVAVAVNLSDLVSKTVFLRVRYGSLGNSRKVPGAQVLSTDADVSLLRVSKTLLESPELDAIRTHDTELRKWLSRTCLPYDVGILLLPVGLITTAEAKLKQHKEERDQLIENFVKVYPAMKEAAQKQLGTLYNETEYPSVEEIRFKFKFDWSYVNFGVPGQLQKISPELYRVEQEKARKQLQDAATEVTAVMRGTLLELVEHLKDRLTPSTDGKKKVLKESAITKVKDFLDLFDQRNVTDDADLAKEVQKVRSLLGSTTAVALRTSEEFREKIRVGMENVTESLSAMIEDKPSRKFRV